ncbi:MAG: restriction endonuclease subunit S [Pseudoflavonifractor capillosus]|uniref:restriction endonuclease subunit S n=1 Tax=Pseudoflavonifractor capillosus TaxID=106588 RepID=UPI0023F69797|nr:restriction endonuclease subunit S [Pseudoflavonifractor capillosus]MCI5928015.1 restriction endonuclease subunit S [Pseudoflavonifractor capillosus]MDY4662109.1 restriction endonuclease subunit S [Pseudoflavonifractor capillosus]
MSHIELGSILHIEKGKKPKRQQTEMAEGLLPYVDIKAFEKGIIDNYASPEKCLLCEDGDLLIVCDGSRSGLTGRAVKGVVGSTLSKIYADGLTTEYLQYFIQSKYVLLNTRKKGTGTPHLNAEILKRSKLIVPPIPEQERIVSRIEELFSKLDASVAELQTAKEKLKVYRQAVLKEAFNTCEEYTKISDVCQHVTDGDHMPPPKADNGIPFIMISNIEKAHINWESTKYVTEDYYKAIGELRTPRKGDILYTVTGSFGIPVIVDFDKKFCFQRHIALLRPNEKITQKYLFYVLQTPYVYMQASKRATGTAQKTVGLSVLRNITIPYCAIKKQIRIIKFLERHLTTCDSIEQTIDTSLQQAEALRQSILKQAFEGEL